MRFRSKETIEAEQFLPPHENRPEGVFNITKNRSGFWTGSIRNTQGRIITIRATDWVIAGDPPGRYTVLSDKKLKERYAAD